MRLITFISLLILSLSCVSSKNATMKSNRLYGNWVLIKQVIGGTLLPKAAFENQKLIISDSTYIFIAESTDKGVVKYKDDKMDIYGKEGVNGKKTKKKKINNEENYKMLLLQQPKKIKKIQLSIIASY